MPTSFYKRQTNPPETVVTSNTEVDVVSQIQSPQKKLNERSTLVMLVAVAVLVSVVNAIIGIVHLVSFGGMRDNLMSAYVIDANGDRRKVSQIVDPKQKEEHIKDYAKLVATALGTYRWYKPTDEGEQVADPGFPVDASGAKVPTAVYLGSLYLDPNFAAKYLPIVANQMKALGIGPENRVSSIFIPARMSQPQKQGESKWLVRVSGTQKTVAQGGETKLIPVVKDVVVREVPTMSKTFAEKSYTEPGLADGYAEAAAWGLRTVYIADIIRGTSTTPNKPK